MITIKGQAIASTELDAHGEQLTKDQLHALFCSWPENVVIYHQHDLGRPPVAIANNLSFVQLPSGEFAIKADVAIHDEQAYEACGGFSMAWLADGYTMHPHTSPVLEIYFNPRVFSEDEAIELIAASTPDAVFNARELKQKALEASVILVIKFVVISAITGFFGKAGSDAYDHLKSKLLALATSKQDKGKHVILNLLVPREINSLGTEVIIEFPAAYLEDLGRGSLSFELAIAIASKVPYVKSVQKVVVKTHGDPPTWVLSHYIKSDGMPVRT